MYCKLAFQNVRRSIRDFAVYFLTLTFGVCLFYVFNSIESQQTMLDLSSTQHRVIEGGLMLMDIISVFIVVILACLILYANRFLMKRRNQELGVYMTLGMDRGKISLILVLETLLVGLFSLLVGLLLGVACSQGLSTVTAAILGTKLKSFQFIFSGTACLKSILYFGLIFVLVMLFNLWAVSKFKLIDLLQAGRRNEELRGKQLWVSVVCFLLSVVSLGFSYLFIIQNGMNDLTDWKFWSSLALGILGTVLFFYSLSGFLLRLVRGNKRLYYKGLNMFILRQIHSKINTTFLSMSVICIMLLITIGTISSGMGAGNMLTSDLEHMAPYDVSILNKTQDTQKNSPLQALTQQGFPLDAVAGEYVELEVYAYNGMTYEPFLKGGLEQISRNKFQMEILTENKITFLGVSQFNKLRQMQGEAPVTLGGQEYLFNSNVDTIKPIFQYYAEHIGTLEIAGQTLRPAKEYLTDINPQTSIMMGSDLGSIVVPDEMLSHMQLIQRFLNLNYPGRDTEQYETSVTEQLKQALGKDCNIYTRQEMIEQTSGLKLTIVYMMLYVGIVFLITSAAVLALQQLTEATDNRRRYALLRKLGAEEHMVNRALLTQIAVYFFLPLALAAVHSAVGLRVVSDVLRAFNYDSMIPSIVVAAVLFAIVYGAYFAATYLGGKAMIRDKNNPPT